MSHVKGEDVASSKLTLQKVKKIKKEWPDLSQTKIAKKYGVNPTTISRIISGQLWRWVK